MNSQPILDCFIPNFKLKYADSQNIKADRKNYSRFQLRSNETDELFSGHLVVSYDIDMIGYDVMPHGLIWFELS